MVAVVNRFGTIPYGELITFWTIHKFTQRESVERTKNLSNKLGNSKLKLKAIMFLSWGFFHNLNLSKQKCWNPNNCLTFLCSFVHKFGLGSAFFPPASVAVFLFSPRLDHVSRVHQIMHLLKIFLAKTH